mmetsp:Transcript_54622/g.175166  ORF Transcript_54622/g.175166 Transcript_54622/m.175166 type:complete len:265 (-) Transcript_54622:52-846(-)
MRKELHLASGWPHFCTMQVIRLAARLASSSSAPFMWLRCTAPHGKTRAATRGSTSRKISAWCLRGLSSAFRAPRRTFCTSTWHCSLKYAARLVGCKSTSGGSPPLGSGMSVSPPWAAASTVAFFGTAAGAAEEELPPDEQASSCTGSVGVPSRSSTAASSSCAVTVGGRTDGEPLPSGQLKNSAPPSRSSTEGSCPCAVAVAGRTDGRPLPLGWTKNSAAPSRSSTEGSCSTSMATSPAPPSSSQPDILPNAMAHARCYTGPGA